MISLLTKLLLTLLISMSFFSCQSQSEDSANKKPPSNDDLLCVQNLNQIIIGTQFTSQVPQLLKVLINKEIIYDSCNSQSISPQFPFYVQDFSINPNENLFSFNLLLKPNTPLTSEIQMQVYRIYNCFETYSPLVLNQKVSNILWKKVSPKNTKGDACPEYYKSKVFFSEK